MQIDIRKIIESKNAKLAKRIPNFLIKKFEKILELKKINYFLAHHSEDTAIDFARNSIDSRSSFQKNTLWNSGTDFCIFCRLF